VIYYADLYTVALKEIDIELREALSEDYLGLGWRESESEGELGELQVYVTSSNFFPVVEQVIAKHDPAAIEAAKQESLQRSLEALNALDTYQAQLAEDWSALTAQEGIARLQAILLDVAVLLKATITPSRLQGG
jgi:hypothetical protein